ncbi:MAG: TPM domain-containing protein [Bacteroidota bacterium]
MKKVYLLLLIISVMLTSVRAEVVYPKPSDPPRLVNDFTNTLSGQQVDALESKLVAFADSTSTQVSVVMIATTSYIPISDYATELGNQWKIGTKGNENGVLLCIAINDKQLFIATGYGVEGALPDALCGKIISNDIRPFFKEGKYFEGIDNGVSKIIDAVKGEPYKATGDKKGYRKVKSGPIFFVLFFFALIIIFKVVSVRRYAMNNGISFWVAWQLLNAATRTHSGRWTDFTRGSGGFGYGGGYDHSDRGNGGGFGGFGGGSFGGGGAGGGW